MTLLRWWWIFCSLVFAAIVSQVLGLFYILWADDLSKLSFVNLGLFTGTTAFIGVLTYRAKKLLTNPNNISRSWLETTVIKYLPMCWFLADAMMGIGMMGTLLGFIMMFTANVSHIDFSNIETAKQILGQLTKGTTTAVVTTFVGLLLSMLTKLQLVSLEQDLDEDEKT